MRDEEQYAYLYELSRSPSQKAEFGGAEDLEFAV
jgi:hypothetical protein